MSAFLDDLSARTISALVEKLGISEQVAKMITAEITDDITRDWRGERPYIGAVDAVRKMSERNRSIIRDFKAGERVCFLVRRYGISRQRIRKIIYG